MNEALYTAYLKGSLRLSADGIWFHNGQAFTNNNVRDLFFRSIVWDADSQQFLVRIGQGQAEFDYEGCVFFVEAVEQTDTGWVLQLTDQSKEELDPNTLYIGSDNALYCRLANTHSAKFLRACYQQLVESFVDEKTVCIAKKYYRIKDEGMK